MIMRTALVRISNCGAKGTTSKPPGASREARASSRRLVDSSTWASRFLRHFDDGIVQVPIAILRGAYREDVGLGAFR